MPIATVSQARDEINARMMAALTAASLQSTFIEWTDIATDTPRADDTVSPPPECPAGTPWLRPTIRHADGRIATLGGVDGRRRHRNAGTFIVQVFTPAGDALQDSNAFVDALISGFSSGGATPNGVQFTNARFREIGKDGSWFQTNFLVDFEYDRFVGP